MIRSFLYKTTAIVAVFGLVLAGNTVVMAAHETGDAGMTKINIYDNTNDIWNVTVGDPDPVIGFVNYRPTVPDDPNHLKLVVHLQDAAPNCEFTIQLVTLHGNQTAGLAPDGPHRGFINEVGTLTTNKHGRANSGAITVDVRDLIATRISGLTTYAHVDLEANGDCMEADGTYVVNNEYAASGKMPGSDLDLPLNMHWTQP